MLIPLARQQIGAFFMLFFTTHTICDPGDIAVSVKLQPTVKIQNAFAIWQKRPDIPISLTPGEAENLAHMPEALNQIVGKLSFRNVMKCTFTSSIYA